jgi:ABC-type phosphate/phosphonate transport system substrate-binding protein
MHESAAERRHGDTRAAPALGASLPMYNIPEMQAAFGAFWQVLRTLATRRGIAGLPAALDLKAPAVPDRIGPEVAFTQVCGFPLLTRLRGQGTILLAPVYDAPGCGGPTHCAFFIVRSDAPYRSIEDLRGTRIACNSLLSNSGMNLPRRTIAAIAGGRGFFAERLMTGSHTASIEAVANGRADVASIDCVTDAVFRRHRPALMARLRTLARSVSSPSLPFVTSSATDPATAEALRQSLLELADGREGRALCAGLLIRGFERLEERHYQPILDHQDEAVRLGYPDLL